MKIYRNIEIFDMAEDGRGIGRIAADDGSELAGLMVFVSGGVYGDKVSVEITKKKKNYALADAVEIIEKSPYRVSSGNICSYIEECGGCAFGKLKYDSQLKLKENQVHQKLSRIGGIKNPIINPIIGMAESGDENSAWPVNYRNKAVISVGRDGAVGFKRRKSHRVIDCKNCFIQAETANRAADVMRNWIRDNEITLVDEMTVKTSFSTGEVMVILKGSDIFRLKKSKEIEDFCYKLDDAISKLNILNSQGDYSLESVALEEVRQGKRKIEIIAGKRTIKDKLMGLDFEISPESFYQVNSIQTENLYGKILEYLNIDNHKDKEDSGTVLDLYCGVGTIGTLMAKNYTGQVIGIESVKEAVIDGNRNAVINGIVNERFVWGKAEEILPELLKRKKSERKSLENEENDSYDGIEIENIQAVILDPPRAGCDEELLESVTKAEPWKIIYVSCNPATLARDLKILTERGYIFIEATPLDMFCHSSHVEVVCLLEKNKEQVI